MTKEDYKAHWRKAKKETFLSHSGLHFGHFIAGIKSDYISHFNALKATLIYQHGLVLERWMQGLSVMPQKLFGCSLITKLHSILLMEADINSASKMMFLIQMLKQARVHNLMPEEDFSEHNKMAVDGTLTKVLTYDIIHQTRWKAGIASFDADNCYDRISESLLMTIQEMKFFLRTRFGDSTDFASLSLSTKTQGVCQGNDASPAEWAVVSICIISTHKKKGYDAYFTCPITKLKSHMASIIYMYDTDLVHFRMEKDQGKDESFFCLQEAITNWGKLLIASGGALKPIKCFFHLISFSWNEDERWTYENNKEEDEFQVVIIKHLGINESAPLAAARAQSHTCKKGIAWKDMITAGKMVHARKAILVMIVLWTVQLQPHTMSCRNSS